MNSIVFKKSSLPLLSIWLIIILVTTIILVVSLKQNSGHFIYALDDPYIHLAIAKNLSSYGVWGIDRYALSSSSSSLLWTLLISFGFYLFGISEYIPFILNIFLSLTLAYLLFRLLNQHFSEVWTFVILLFITFSTPLFFLIFTGQEHILHNIVTILFAFETAKFLSSSSLKEQNLKEKLFQKHFMKLLVLSAILTSVRFEGLFLLFVASLLFLIRGRHKFGLALLLFGLLPVFVFGVVSVANGGFFLPNSVLLKGTLPDLSTIKGVLKLFGGTILVRMINFPELLVLFIVCSLILLRLIKTKSLWTFEIVLSMLFVGTLLLHLEFARVGFFFRYDAYLITWGLVTILITGREFFSNLFEKINIKPASIKLLSYCVMCLSIIPFIIRAYSGTSIIVPAMNNIYSQQYQMALFVKENYNGSVVALNDIGFVNFLADIGCIDLWGLGNTQVAKSILDRAYNTKRIHDIAKENNVEMGILYEHWYRNYGGLPQEWIKVGYWRIPNNVICGGETVTFYAIDTSKVSKLLKALKKFASKLPKDVYQYGAYTETN
jgi:hypothetical protein